MKHLILSAALTALALFAGCGDNQTHPTHSTYTGSGGGAGGSIACLPNLDGKIDATEFKAVLGIQVSYLVGNDRPVNLVGTVDTAGHRLWDYSTDDASDGVIGIEATSLVGKWYQASFTGGQWVAPADALGKIEGVYSSDDGAVYLHGLASKVESGAEGKTLLVYDEKVTVYRFPLAPGVSFTSESTVTNGIVNNLPYNGKHTYEVKDDATGELKLYDYDFTQAHRIRTTLTIHNAQGADVVRRQTGFVYECFGEVMRATAKDNEPSEDFTTAAELRRLTVQPSN
jgi:hypothetical protein